MTPPRKWPAVQEALILNAALEAWNAGLAPVPILLDGTKRAARAWKGRAAMRGTREDVEADFAEPRALGIICGSASGGVELLEFEACAVEEGIWDRWCEDLRAAGWVELVERLLTGYLEQSPRGGRHVLYRLEGEVPGNTKLARRPANPGVDVLVETRGEGGYVCVAPSSGRAHPSGKPWRMLAGGFPTIPTITAAEREVLVAAARVYDEMPGAPERPSTRSTASEQGGRPGDDYDARHTCSEVLERNGWQVVRSRGDEVFWARPGKSPREGHSGVEHTDEPNLFVCWSSSVELEPERGYSPFGLVVALEHGGDVRAAARELGKAGYGEQARKPSASPVITQAKGGMVLEGFIPDAPSSNGHGPTPPAPFPLEVFPSDLRVFVEQTCRSVCCAPEMLAPLMLSVAGALIGKRRSLGFKWDWQEYPKVWTLVVAGTGQRKSPALKRALKALGPAQERLTTEHERELEEYEETASTKGARKGEPQERRLLVKDATIEAVAERISLHPRGIVLARDELAGWALGMGQYKPNGKGDDRQKWLELWSGDDLLVDRKGRPTISVPDPFLVVCGGIQPTAIPDLQRPGVDDGMCERFLMALPEEMTPEAATPPVEREVADYWRDVGLGLYDLPGADGDQLMPTEDGRAALIEQIQALYDDRPERGAAAYGAWCKADAQLLRVGVVLAELWHVAEGQPEAATPETAEMAALVVRWFLAQDEAVMSRYGGRAQEYERANPGKERDLLAWIRSRGGEASKREAMTYGPLQRMSAKEAEAILAAVAVRGHVVVRNEDRGRVVLTLSD